MDPTFVDLKTAFDTVDNVILCRKLEQYGIQQRRSEWFKFYLYNQRQFCRVNGVKSKIEKIEGVPQDSCLDPFLFLIYRNNLPHAIQNSAVCIYADDTRLCYQTSNINDLNEAIDNDLMKLDTWLKSNKLSLNVAKTNCMIIATKQTHSFLKHRNEDLNLAIRNKEIEVIRKNEYLGVVIDISLNWKERTKTVSAKVSKAIGFLRHAKAFLLQETLKTLFTGILEPHSRYCYFVLGCSGSTEINQL